MILQIGKMARGIARAFWVIQLRGPLGECHEETKKPCKREFQTTFGFLVGKSENGNGLFGIDLGVNSPGVLWEMDFLESPRNISTNATHYLHSRSPTLQSSPPQ